MSIGTFLSTNNTIVVRVSGYSGASDHVMTASEAIVFMKQLEKNIISVREHEINKNEKLISDTQAANLALQKLGK